MTLFNVSNFDESINEDPENFKFLKPIPKQWNYKGKFNGLKQKQDLNGNYIISGMPNKIQYKSVPILYQHRQSFANIWTEFESNSLITNRGCLKQLATMNISSNVKKCVFKFYKARDFKTGEILDKYILEIENLMDNENLENYQECFFNGACVAAMLTKNGKLSSEFNTFKNMSFKLGFKKISRTSSCHINSENGTPRFLQPKSSVKVYYTSEIDAFIKDGYGNKSKFVPVEIKAKFDKNNNMKIPPKTAFSTALQCELAGINDIVFGFHDGERIQNVQRYSLQDLKKIALTKNEKLNVDKAIKEAKFLLKEIINQFDERVGNGTMDIWDTLIIVKRLEIKENRYEQRYCLDYHVRKMLKPFQGAQIDRYIIPSRRKTCDF
uniref:Decapping nuclease n=1 Tax=Panagrolaimus davidi TaxID=227884 RepID=A0A914PWD9_9BILA